MLKILHLGKYYYPQKGGMETVLKLLCEGLTELNNQVSVLCSGTSYRDSCEMINQVKVFRLARLTELFGQAINPMLYFKFRKLMKEYDIIHVHSPNPLVELAVILFSNKTPVVVTHHSDVVRQKILKLFYNPIYKLFLKKVKRIVVPTENHIKYSDTLIHFKDKCSFATFGIRTNHYEMNQRMKERANLIERTYGDYILFVGRLVGYKGLDVLIRAMQHVKTRLLIIGEGPLFSELKAQAIMLGLGEQIFFVGSIDDDEELMAFYHACQLFVLPSTGRNENFGMVQIEAMACKKPVVTTHLLTGVPCVGIPNQTTLLTQVGDHMELSKAINRLLEDDNLRKKMGELAYQRAITKYDWMAMAKEYQTIYLDNICKEKL